MRRFSLTLTCVLCFTCLATTVFAQTIFSRRTYTHQGVVRADFNHDGKPDLLGGTTGKFSVLLNNGDGTFHGPVITTQPGTPQALTPADFNRDGRSDLAGCHAQAPDGATEFAIWIGTGPGTFSQPKAFSIGGACRSVAVEDFNQDGFQDAAVIWTVTDFSSAPNNGITVFFGDGAGNVRNSITTDHISAMSETGACWFNNGVAGNYDRAGSPDLMIATSCPEEVVDESTVIFAQGTGTGHFAFSTTDSQNLSLALGKDELNQDSRLDLLVKHTMSGPHAASSTGLSFWTNTNTGGVPAWEKKTVRSYGGDGDCISRLNGGVALDINGDGIKDAAFTEAALDGDCIDSTYEYHLGIMLGRADGSFGAQQNFILSSSPLGMVSGDFDRDGRPDLAVNREPNSIEVFLNRSNIATCPANPTLRTVKICAPTTIPGNTLQLRANTTSGGPVNAMKVYVDNTEAYFTPNDTINHKLTVPSGSHRITVRAWDGQGSFASSMTVNATGSSACAPPAQNRTINLCSPVNESTVSNPVKVMAAITTSNQYYSAKVYIDGVAKHSTTSKQVNASFTLAAGRHRVSVQAYDTQGAFTKTVYVNVR